MFWFMVVMHISNRKRTVGMKTASEMGCGGWSHTHRTAQEYNLNTSHLTVSLSNEISTSHRSHKNENTKQKKCTVEYCAYSKIGDNTCGQKHDSPLLITLQRAQVGVGRNTLCVQQQRHSESSSAATAAVSEISATNNTTVDELANDINHLKALLG